MKAINWVKIFTRAELTNRDFEWIWEFLDVFEEVYEEHKAVYTRYEGHYRQKPGNYHKRISKDLQLPSERLLRILNRDYTPTLHEIVMYDQYWKGALFDRWEKKINNFINRQITSINLHNTQNKAINNQTKPISNVDIPKYTKQSEFFVSKQTKRAD